MPTRVDRVKLLVMTDPQGVLFWPHPHIYPWDKPVVLVQVAETAVSGCCCSRAMIRFRSGPRG
jgi:hypothetical protein